MPTASLRPLRHQRGAKGKICTSPPSFPRKRESNVRFLKTKMDSRFHGNDETSKISETQTSDNASPPSNPIPCYRAWDLHNDGEFSASGCLSEASFRLPSQNKINFRKQAVGGSLFFGYFLLAKQKKVNRVSRESDHSPIRTNPKLKVTRFRLSSEWLPVRNVTPHHTLNDAPPA